MNRTYSYLISHSEYIPKEMLKGLLLDNELYCLARWLKEKFNDERDICDIKDMIIEEYAIRL